jgi:hypothetical protein
LVVTSLLGARVIMDTLATLIDNGHLWSRLSLEERQRAEAERDKATGVD